jgi:hypothetical protein
MTRTLDSQQGPLWVRSELTRLDLVHLITYDDRANDAEGQHFYFAKQPVEFNYDTDGVVDFWPLLKELGPLSTSINHLPSPDTPGLLRKPWSFTLSNEPWFGPPEITHTLVTSGTDNANQTSYTTASIQPTGDRTLLAAVYIANSLGIDPVTPTLSGNGLTWTLVDTAIGGDAGDSRERITVFRASGSSPTSGVLTIDCGAQTQDAAGWSVHEFEGTDTTTDNGVVQANSGHGDVVNTFTVTLSPFADSMNPTFGAFCRDTNVNSIAAGSGFEEIVNFENLYSGQMMVELKYTSDTSVDASSPNGADWGGVAVELASMPREATRLINALRGRYTLENARVEWTQVALSERPTTSRIDLTALTGDEHTFIYRGRVRRVGPITNDSITIECDMDMPDMTWVRSSDATETDPDHVGVRVAKVVGEAKKVACVNWDVGFISTLAVAVSSSAESLELSDATGFGNTGSGTLGGEQVSWTGKSTNTLTGVTRGESSSRRSPPPRSSWPTTR